MKPSIVLAAAMLLSSAIPGNAQDASSDKCVGTGSPDENFAYDLDEHYNGATLLVCKGDIIFVHLTHPSTEKWTGNVESTPDDVVNRIVEPKQLDRDHLQIAIVTRNLGSSSLTFHYGQGQGQTFRFTVKVGNPSE
jgi:hypothetical protein